MLKIAVIGGAETVIGFKALGLEVCPVANAEVLEILGDVNGKNCLIVDDFTISGGTLVNLAQELQRDIDRYKDNPKPAIILIPGREGSLGLGQSALKAAVERAVGSDIL